MARTPHAKPSGAKRPPQRKKSAAKPHNRGSGAKTAKKVEIFTASFCPHCQDAKFYFRAHRIPFVEYNLERSGDAEKKFRGYGGKAVPLIVVKGKLLRRWDQKAFEKLYRES